MWEALDGRLKNKLEIQWYDIMSINATYPDDGHGTLDVVPLFLSDTNHQPKHYGKKPYICGGHASLHRADKKGQTTLHMEVKGQNVVVVSAFTEVDNALINMVDKWDNTALHMTTTKGHTEIV
nr:ankyrin repeat-containing protein At5g02620-like [Tanacetum cinerariifolium]